MFILLANKFRLRLIKYLALFAQLVKNRYLTQTV